jgi:hypothetical protein
VRPAAHPVCGNETIYFDLLKKPLEPVMPRFSAAFFYDTGGQLSTLA